MFKVSLILFVLVLSKQSLVTTLNVIASSSFTLTLALRCNHIISCSTYRVKMPSLKQLTCYLKWNDTGVCLNEYHTAYADGYVETYVAVPEIPTSFSIHLTSNGYIAPGLAMFIYMDGVGFHRNVGFMACQAVNSLQEYQCNRNRGNLMIPDGILSRKHTEIDFHVRQKETFLSDGSFWGKQWRFEKLNIGMS